MRYLNVPCGFLLSPGDYAMSVALTNLNTNRLSVRKSVDTFVMSSNTLGMLSVFMTLLFIKYISVGMRCLASYLRWSLLSPGDCAVSAVWISPGINSLSMRSPLCAPQTNSRISCTGQSGYLERQMTLGSMIEQEYCLSPPKRGLVSYRTLWLVHELLLPTNV